jgi:mono/diheme cytochrome c family protein
MLKFLGALVGPLLITSCLKAQVQTKPLPVPPAKPAAVSKVDQATLDKGRRLYMSNCIQCHHRDPNMKGPIGPEMTDAPLEIMTAKVMTGRYPEKLPEGFVPKRSTKLMRPIPKLKDDIPAIYEWVQSMKKKPAAK